MKICFFGSMTFASVILEALHNTFGVDLVVTQPDRPVGRKKVLQGTPVKQKAVALGIETFQPEHIKSDYQRVLAEPFDFIIVAAYGQMIPESILYHGTYQAMNVHASLLPKYRGGTPMHRAIMSGETFSGISIMYMVKKMDAGDILNQQKVYIEKEDDVSSLEMKLAQVGAETLIETMQKLEKQEVKPIPQDETQVSYAYHIQPEERMINLHRSAKSCFNQIRGLHPWPIAKLDVNGHVMKVFKADYQDENLSQEVGEVVLVNKNGVYLQTKSGVLILKEVQLEGKKRMPIQAFMNGVGKEIFRINKKI